MAGTILVTGATRGIGRAIALRFARDGWDVVAVARKKAELDALCDEIGGHGVRCRAIVLDVADGAAVARELGGIDVDVLVNNAGVGVIKPFMELTPEEWHRMVDVNVNALYHVTRAVLPAMVAKKGGHVCTIGSIGSRSVFAGGTCYGATKAFVTSWAENLMIEVREHGVKVSVVMPGAVATEFNGNEPGEKDQWKLMPDDVADAVATVVATPPNVLIHRLEVRTLTVPARGKGR
ncbi:MAG TPA: SDR family NAD(P)-dependent oxidoreductase [Gemmatimonadaceae bacterium]|jgi:3-oxoacyl-[acyl-carrier protein] reductase